MFFEKKAQRKNIGFFHFTEKYIGVFNSTVAIRRKHGNR